MMQASSGDTEEARELISEGADVNAKTEYGHTPLHSVSTGSGNAEIAKLLIEAGADVNTRNTHGTTPLHRAVEFRKAGVVKVFIEAGAYVCEKDYPRSIRPLIYAQHRLDSAKESIIQHKQKPKVSTEFLEKELKNSKEVIKLLEAEMKKQGCLESSGETHPASK